MLTGRFAQRKGNDMNDNSFAEYTEVSGSQIQVFAMRIDDKIVWSIGSDTNGIGIKIGDTSPYSVESLKDLHKSIGEAIKFANVKQKEINDESKI